MKQSAKSRQAGPIWFGKAHLTGNEIEYIDNALKDGRLAGGGRYTAKCVSWLEDNCRCRKAYLTHSCTAALELAALLLELKPGDEVIVPSYTFMSTANAFVLQGAVPVFVDVRPDTLNIDEDLIEAAITGRTRAIVPVHYAGVSCDMDRIVAIAREHGLVVVEDAAQGVLARYKGRPLGSLGDIGGLSFHGTKHIICGQGGAVLVNNPDYAAASEVLFEKGSNRRAFLRDEVAQYEWVGPGSAFEHGEINAAFLWAQLEAAEEIVGKRRSIWDRYHQGLSGIEAGGKVTRPTVPPECEHPAHIYYLLAQSGPHREAVSQELDSKGVEVSQHFKPLHSSPGGRRYGRSAGEITVATGVSERIVRLPLWPDMTDTQVDFVIEAVSSAFDRLG